MRTELKGDRRTYSLVVEENVNNVPDISVISTKYSDTLPLIDTTAKMVATSFVFEFICRFGFD